MRIPFWAYGAFLVFAGGCLYPVRENIDPRICELASQVRDVEPATPKNLTPSEPKKSEPAAPEKKEDDKSKPRLTIPPGLPGGEAKPIDWPKGRDSQQKEAQRLYPKLPPLGPEPPAAKGPDGKPYSLSSMQQLAAAHSPILAQAYHDYEAARGQAIQAGAYPNPNVFYQADTVGTSGGLGYQGFGFNQLIKTAGKLKLQQAAATMDLLNAELNLRKVQNDVATQVRSNYFGVLVARENMKISRVVAQFTDEIYRVQVDLLEKGGFPAPYEPMALRVSADQARLNLLQSQKTYTASWRQLAAAIGLKDLPLTELAGRVDIPIPKFEYDKTLARILSKHTDALTAENGIQKARFNLRFAQVTPIPDLGVNALVQKDNTGPPFNIVYSLQLSVPLAIWDQNKGNIISAQAQLLRATEEPHRVREDLTSRLAQAFRDYEYNREALETYRNRILPDQVRFYRGVYERRGIDPAVSFGDLVNAQQTLTASVSTYVGLLGSMWSSVVSIADLLQTDDLFNLAPPEEIMPVPDLSTLTPLPCLHPCNPKAPGVEGNPMKPNIPTECREASIVPAKEEKTTPKIEKDEPAPLGAKGRELPRVPRKLTRQSSDPLLILPPPPPPRKVDASLEP